jgi:hypothetical protein
MIIGIVVLIVVASSRELEFRYGVIGYIGAFACIGYGIKAIIDSYKEKTDRKREIPDNPAVETFYQNTKQAWMDDKLKDLGPIFKLEGISNSVKQFKTTYLPHEGSALSAFFTRFAPQPDEYLISMSQGDDNAENAWFVLTNKRLVQKDGETDDYSEFDLKDIAEYTIDKQKAELSLKTRSGQMVVLKRVSGFPMKKHIDVLISSN